jgi:hypothetical protein
MILKGTKGEIQVDKKAGKRESVEAGKFKDNCEID